MNKTTLMIFVVTLALIGGSAYLFSRPATESGNNATSTPSTSTPSAATTTGAVSRVQLAMLDTSGTMAGKSRGCDRVILVPQNIATTTAPLTAAMRALFAISTTTVQGLFNYIDRTNETLKFDRATVDGAVARIYLTGSLSGLAGVCDDPRTAIQIEETALAFSTVQSVEIYLNGTKTNLIPSQQ